MRTPTGRLEEIRQIIDDVDWRALATDGPVPSTLQEMTPEEMRRIYKLTEPPKRRKKKRRQKK